MPCAVAVGLSERSSHHTRMVPTTLRRPATSSVALAHSTVALRRPEKADRQLGRECHRLDPAGRSEHQIPERSIGEPELRRPRHEGARAKLGVGDLATGHSEVGAERITGVARAGKQLLDHLVDGFDRRQRRGRARRIGSGRHPPDATAEAAVGREGFPSGAQAWHRVEHDRHRHRDVPESARPGHRRRRFARWPPCRRDAPTARRCHLDRRGRRRGASPVRPAAAVEEAPVG